MKIEHKNILVRDLVKDYKEDTEQEWVRGYGGKLDIRPPYQREFVYADKDRNAVIGTVVNGYPLNVMYWAVREDGSFEIIDGQQRTISVCQYVTGIFSFYFHNLRGDFYFVNLKQEEQDKILNYELSVYQCSGTDRERLKWFETINIAGKPLSNQELKNAIYYGSWVTDAKRYFVKHGCPAYARGKDYLSGKRDRGDYLETAIKWISSNNVSDYMAENQNKPNAKPLWEYFESVIDWVEKTFASSVVNRKSLMKNVPWGELYKKYSKTSLNPDKLENEINKLMEDEEVTNQKGIFTYVLTRDERSLNIRVFNHQIKMRIYEKQKRKCKKCSKEFEFKDMDGDHILPWNKSGKTTEDNCQMLCVACNRS